MAHCTNLAIIAFSFLRFISKVESLLAGMYNYFTHNPKQHLEFCKLVEILESKGNKLFKNIKTWWISKLSPCKIFFAEYNFLVVKMVEDSDHIENAKSNYELLCDVETFLRLACILLYLETMQGLFKFAQGWDTFICDFISALKFAKEDLFIMYCDSENNYNPQHLSLLIEFIEHISDVVYLTWWKEPTSEVDYIGFLVGGKLYSCMLQIQSLGSGAW